MKKVKGGLSLLFPLLFLALLMPGQAFAGGTETIEAAAEESAENTAKVTNPAASIELVDPAADSNFVLYSYDGTGQPVLPSDYPWYDTKHTVKVRLVGEDPEKECDDIVTFKPGQACDVATETEGKVEEEPGVWYCTVVMAGHDGPSHYTAETTSGKSLKFMATAETIPSAVSLNYQSYSLEVGRIIKLTSSETGKWESSNPQVAQVSTAGIVTGISDGTADIIFTYEGYGLTLNAACKVTVGTGVSTAAPNSSGSTGISGSDTKTTVSVKKNTVYTAGTGTSKGQYKVANVSKRTVAYTKCLSAKKTAVVPASVKLRDGKTYKVVRIASGAFASAAKVKNVEIKTGKLTKNNVKNCLKRSKVVKIRTVKYSSYKKYFTKKNCGKSVKIVRI